MHALSTKPAELPSAVRLEGRRVVLLPLDAEAHAAPLYAALRGHDELWRYLFDSPPADEHAFKASLRAKMGMTDPYFLAIADAGTGKPVGIASYLRIEPHHRVIEVGNILFTPLLQRTAHATEAMYLMAKHVFDVLGYRRYEWKCNSLNAPSRRAALRLGFSFEGIFRQHMIVKGESRDTAWFAMVDGDWPYRRRALEAWLSDDNFDAAGVQRQPLAAFQK